MTNFKDTSILELAAIVSRCLHDHQISAVLVGGLAVEIYTENLYLTKDIDMVDISYARPANINKAMATIGFIKQGRVYVNSSTDICVEFPSGPLSVGEELIQKTTTIEVGKYTVPVLFPEDVVKDRLAAYFHWKDTQSLVQALAVLIKHSVDSNELRKFCNREGVSDSHEKIIKLQKDIAHQKLTSMLDIENLIIQKLLEDT